MALGDVFRLVTYSKCDGQAGINVLHIRNTNQVGADIPPALIAAQYGSTLSTFYRNLMSVEATYAGASVQRIHPAPIQAPVFSILGAGTGSQLLEPLPKQVCGIITKKTPLAGRKNRGRVYVPFLSEIQCFTGGRPTAAAVALMQLLGDAMLAAQAVANGPDTSVFNLVLLNRDGPALTILIDTMTARPRFGTQRRRGDYSSPNQLPV